MLRLWTRKRNTEGCIKPNHTNLNRNPDPRLSAEIIDRLSSEFGFQSAYDLRGALDEAIARYRKLTSQTKLQRQRQRSSVKHWLKIASKRAQRGDRKNFKSSLKKAWKKKDLLVVMYMAIGGSNPFRDSLEKSAQAGKAALEMMMKRSGRPKDVSALFIYGLIHIYEKGTGKRARMPNAEVGGSGPFFRFVTDVFKLAGIRFGPSALAKKIQRRIKELRDYRAMRGAHR